MCIRDRAESAAVAVAAGAADEDDGREHADPHRGHHPAVAARAEAEGVFGDDDAEDAHDRDDEEGPCLLYTSRCV